MFKSIVNEIVKYYSYFEIENSRDKWSKIPREQTAGKNRVAGHDWLQSQDPVVPEEYTSIYVLARTTSSIPL